MEEAMKKKISANDVADFLLKLAYDSGDLLTNKKLQKLIYYAQAWYLALYNKPLFNDKIEAWVFGPVQPDVYHRFKKYKWDRIPKLSTSPKLPEDVEDHLKEIMDAYMRFSSWDLERLTHTEDPWKSARAGLPPDEPSNAEISPEAIREYFKKVLDGKEEKN